MVYAGPTFHDEVASVAACILHDLGFYVVVYIGNGWHFMGMMVPFSGNIIVVVFILFCNIVHCYLFYFMGMMVPFSGEKKIDNIWVLLKLEIVWVREKESERVSVYVCKCVC